MSLDESEWNDFHASTGSPVRDHGVTSRGGGNLQRKGCANHGQGHSDESDASHYLRDANTGSRKRLARWDPFQQRVEDSTEVVERVRRWINDEQSSRSSLGIARK